MSSRMRILRTRVCSGTRTSSEADMRDVVMCYAIRATQC